MGVFIAHNLDAKTVELSAKRMLQASYVGIYFQVKKNIF